METFRLLMLSAMYENGGNTTHRLLDGHPQLAVYPFESQLGTRLVNDRLTSVFPVKYRWPVFPLDGTAAGDYLSIIDEECKVRARTPHVSKFRHWPFELDDDERGRIYEESVAGVGRSRAGNVAAFFRATFAAWRNHRRSGAEVAFVGYSPIVIVDAELILADFPAAHVVHIVRNPWSAYADTRKRPVPLGLGDYLQVWSLVQEAALVARDRFPGQVHLLRLEDILSSPQEVLGGLCGQMGLDRSSTLDAPSWNGERLSEVYPWGTLRTVTPAANRAAASELSSAERSEIRLRTRRYLEIFDYTRLVD